MYTILGLHVRRAECLTGTIHTSSLLLAYLLLGKLGNAPPPPLDFLKNLGDAAPPLLGGDFWVTIWAMPILGNPPLWEEYYRFFGRAVAIHIIFCE